MDTGRNDPCPCGSGKKYKKCCLGQAGAAPFTAAGVSDGLRQALAGQEFSSMAEAQAFTERLVQQRNRAPLDQFCGLSPEQMYQALYFPFDSPQLVTFPAVLEITPTAPILTLFSLLAEAIGEQGLKPTVRGNLPQKFCREAALKFLGEEGYRDRTRYGGIHKEEDFYELHCTRLVAELAGLVRKHKGVFILSSGCRKLLADGGLAAIYPRLLRGYVEQFSWAYGDRYPELQIIQQAFLFTLYLLDRCGDAPRPQNFYAEAFIQAFPAAVDEVEPGLYCEPVDEVCSCYTQRTLVWFAAFLGLATVTPLAGDKRYSRHYQITKLPLLAAAVQFHIQR